METSEFSEWMMWNLKQPLIQLDDDTWKSSTIEEHLNTDFFYEDHGMCKVHHFLS